MNNEDKYQQHLDILHDVYDVSQWTLFVLLDIVLLSFFLGLILHSQTEQWLTTLLIPAFFCLFSSGLFLIFFDKANRE